MLRNLKSYTPPGSPGISITLPGSRVEVDLGHTNLIVPEIVDNICATEKCVSQVVRGLLAVLSNEIPKTHAPGGSCCVVFAKDSRKTSVRLSTMDLKGRDIIRMENAKSTVAVELASEQAHSAMP